MSSKKIPGVLTDEEVARIAKEELNEDPARIKGDIKAIQEWMKKQPHLHKYARSDETSILGFLRGCKFSLERTKEKIDTHYTVRTACPEWFKDWDISEPLVQYCLEKGVDVPLRGFDKHGRKVVIFRPGVVDPKLYTLTDLFRFAFMLTDLIQEEMDQSTVMGLVSIMDADNMGMGIMTSFNPTMGKKSTIIWQDAYPSRPKAIHFLNMPSFIDIAFNLMKSFAKDKMKERMLVHSKGDLKGLQEAVGLEVLPEEYGGTNGKMQDHIDDLKVRFEEKRKFFSQQTKLKANEEKRRGMPKTHSEIFGMVGSFRQLEFD